MVELNMIDTMGYGIRSIHIGQAKRYLPMPDYDLQEPRAVKLTIHGRVVDPAYSRLLMQKTDLPLDEILALDRVQKKLPLTDDMIKRLRQDKLIEGRKPNLHVSVAVAEATAEKSAYIKNRAFDDRHYEEMIIKYLNEFGRASRKDIDELLRDKLSDTLDERQKKYKIGNLLSGLRKNGRIYNAGSRTVSEWRLRE